MLLLVLLPGQLKPTDRTGILGAQPWRQASWVEDVTAWHEHSICVEFDVLDTDCARGWLQMGLTGALGSSE